MTRDTTSQAVLEDFIRQFGNSIYGSMARARLEELKKTQVATASFDQELGRSLQLELKRVGCYQGPLMANLEMRRAKLCEASSNTRH